MKPMEISPRQIVLMLLMAVLCASCDGVAGTPAAARQSADDGAPANLQTAVFAAGCFWCVEQAFDAVPGVVETTSGFSGGRVVNPSYKQVSAGRTGHAEVVRVRFDPKQVSYGDLLNVFWRNLDPTDAGGQFCDRGSPYRGAIFPVDDEQMAAAIASRQGLREDAAAPSPIVTEIVRFEAFYAAEDYHQDYYRKNPLRYNYYKTSCGRARRLEAVWGHYPG